MLLESHLRLTMSVLYCSSLDVLWLPGASPTMEPSITIEHCRGHRLQIPQIFLHTSDSHLCLNFFTDQPNDAEVDTATAKRLYTCHITYYSTFMSISEPPLPQLLQRPTQWCWGRHSYGKEVVHLSHHLLLYIHVHPLGLFWFKVKTEGKT